MSVVLLLKETVKPYGYVLIDNQPKTSPDHQAVSNIFGECQRYPSITTHNSREPIVTIEKRKDDFESPTAKKPKREVKTQLSAIKIAAKKESKRKPTQKQKKSQASQQVKKTMGWEPAKTWIAF